MSPAREGGAGAGVNEVEVVPSPPRSPPLPGAARPPRRPDCGPGPWRASPRDEDPASRTAMARRSSLSIRIVEGKNLPAKDM